MAPPDVTKLYTKFSVYSRGVRELPFFKMIQAILVM